MADAPQPLSAQVLISQGSCCGNGCQNCPYQPKGEKGSVVIRKEVLPTLKKILKHFIP